MGAKKILHLMRKSPPPPEHKENGTKKKKKNPLYEKSLPPPHKREKKVPQIDCFPGEPGKQISDSSNNTSALNVKIFFCLKIMKS